jgi:hypothetical protein
MSNEEIKKSTENYIDVVLKQAEDKVGVSMTEVLVESTLFLEKLSSSLLIVAGAAITLGIGNSAAVILALGSGSFKAFIVLLILSALVGFMAKVCHAVSLVNLNIAKELIVRMEAIFSEFDSLEKEEIEKVKSVVDIEPRSPNLKRIFSSFVSTLPTFLQEKVRKQISSQEYDGKKAQRSASTAAFSHVVLFLIQAALITVAFFTAVLGVE